MPCPLRSTTFCLFDKWKLWRTFTAFHRAPRWSTEGSPCTTTAAWHPHCLGDVPKGEDVGCVGVYTVFIGPAHGWLVQSERNLNALAGLNTRINELRGRESKPGLPRLFGRNCICPAGEKFLIDPQLQGRAGVVGGSGSCWLPLFVASLSFAY